mgnify:CR=1 FL=1|tara:strand:+ start:149 stop:1258 length:1110 start_codon:yes stop_codon:yes gene_type:complete
MSTKNTNYIKHFIKTINKIKLNSIQKQIITTTQLKRLKKALKANTALPNINPLMFLQRLQDKLEKNLTNDTNRVILKQSRYWASSITWVLMGGTIFGLGWLSIAKTEEVVIAFGKLVPTGGVVDIQMPLEGIAKEILVKEGQKVKEDQILIKLDTSITEARNIALTKSFELNTIILDKLQFLVKEGAVSELQVLEQQAKLESIKSDIKTNSIKLKYQEIRSPINGIVFELQPKSPGFVAQTSQPVMQVIPLDNLFAKIEIDSRSIGFVQTGKAAEISIDSYPASDFGVIKGNVSRIGSDTLPPNPSEGKGYRFPAEIKLNTQYLMLKTGKKLPLQTGMSLTANIKLRKVTYLQLLLNKFSDKANSLKAI